MQKKTVVQHKAVPEVSEIGNYGKGALAGLSMLECQCPSICGSIYLTIDVWSVCLCVCLSIYSIYLSIYLSMYLSISKVVRTWEWWYVWFSELARSHTVRFHCVLKLICQKCSKRTCCLHVPFFAAHAPDVYDIFRNVTFNFKVLRQAGILFSIVFFELRLSNVSQHFLKNSSCPKCASTSRFAVVSKLTFQQQSEAKSGSYLLLEKVTAFNGTFYHFFQTPVLPVNARWMVFCFIC